MTDRDESDDDLPKFDLSATTILRDYIKVGNLAWVKWKSHPFWPALILDVVFTKKEKLEKVCVAFIEYTKAGKLSNPIFWIKYNGSNITSIFENFLKIKEAGLQSNRKASFSEGISRVEAYIFGNKSQNVYEFFAVNPLEVKTVASDRNDKPFVLKSLVWAKRSGCSFWPAVVLSEKADFKKICIAFIDCFKKDKQSCCKQWMKFTRENIFPIGKHYKRFKRNGLQTKFRRSFLAAIQKVERYAEQISINSLKILDFFDINESRAPRRAFLEYIQREIKVEGRNSTVAEEVSKFQHIFPNPQLTPMDSPMPDALSGSAISKEEAEEPNKMETSQLGTTETSPVVIDADDGDRTEGDYVITDTEYRYTKETTRIIYIRQKKSKELANFILASPEIKDRVKSVFIGEYSSSYEDDYDELKRTKGGRLALIMRSYGPIEQYDERVRLTFYLSDILETLARKQAGDQSTYGRSSYVNNRYLMDVIIPEAITLGIELMQKVTRTEAEEVFAGRIDFTTEEVDKSMESLIKNTKKDMRRSATAKF